MTTSTFTVLVSPNNMARKMYSGKKSKITFIVEKLQECFGKKVPSLLQNLPHFALINC